MEACHTVQCGASRLLVLTLAVCELALAAPAVADVVTASDGQWKLLAMVTGFHSVTEPNSPFQLRVIEANGQATVAINPISLYFVVTNDSSAGDLQEHIWRLPVTVARVKSVARISSGVRILAILDAMPDTNVETRAVALLVRYELANGKLKHTVTVQQEAAGPE
jgi:hypothetical protein